MAKTKRVDAGAPTKRRRTVVLPDDACPTCGAMMRRTDRSIAFPVNGERILVPGIPHLRCPKCGEAVLDLHESWILSERAMTEYRTRHHLLSGQEIKLLRKRLGLTQAGLARLLRLGGSTISRWESGRTVQMAAMDVLLRLVRDVPETVRFLRNRKD